MAPGSPLIGKSLDAERFSQSFRGDGSRHSPPRRDPAQPSRLHAARGRRRPPHRGAEDPARRGSNGAASSSSSPMSAPSTNDPATDSPPSSSSPESCVAAASGLLHISAAALVGAILLVLTGSLRIDEAYRAVDWQVVFLLGGILPLGHRPAEDRRRRSSREPAHQRGRRSRPHGDSRRALSGDHRPHRVHVEHRHGGAPGSHRHHHRGQSRDRSATSARSPSPSAPRRAS